ncbi:MAG TPA: hypothetical protein VIM10_07505 [Actinopolymorphaceae bacterium]|jgi:hypothetical protein
MSALISGPKADDRVAETHWVGASVGESAWAQELGDATCGETAMKRHLLAVPVVGLALIATAAVAMKNGPKGLRAPLMLAGTVLEDAEQSWFKSVMPPPARLLWWLIGRKGYENYIALIRGDLAHADIAVS